LTTDSDKHPIGGSDLRADTILKMTDTAECAEDIVMPGLLCARVLRCLHPHARLVSAHVEGGASLPGVSRIVTAADIPGLVSSRARKRGVERETRFELATFSLEGRDA
jgi:CO/xanthine dehydrogenase Mo-binding subunit